ncbi:Tbox protein H15like [Caligus rogercresseyi]|uniref:Tbox protein H15like n=1 Tax=Caligus rogercresseyi TaxID=217165 RepID=A0A7T8KK78_CALRO|nr:Tbox protein H15like [Caligus rogercresseyi]
MDSGVIKSGLKMTNFSIDAIMKVDKEPKDESLDLGDVEEELDVVETYEEDDVSISKKQPKKKEKMTSKFNTEEMRYVTCTLETKELWDKFHDLETEMIITKTGR